MSLSQKIKPNQNLPRHTSRFICGDKEAGNSLTYLFSKSLLGFLWWTIFFFFLVCVVCVCACFLHVWACMCRHKCTCVPEVNVRSHYSWLCLFFEAESLSQAQSSQIWSVGSADSELELKAGWYTHWVCMRVPGIWTAAFTMAWQVI